MTLKINDGCMVKQSPQLKKKKEKVKVLTKENDNRPLGMEMEATGNWDGN